MLLPISMYNDNELNVKMVIETRSTDAMLSRSIYAVMLDNQEIAGNICAFSANISCLPG
jgi:hypothetical protein